MTAMRGDGNGAIKTAGGYHVPVMLHESIDALCIRPGGIYVDVTFGGGGHSREILSRMDGKARLFCFDQDPDAERNIIGDSRLTFIRSNFRYLKNWMRYYDVSHIDGLIADLGVSSHHLDDSRRGFSFRYGDAPLDMRMNRRGGKTAADIINNYDEERLADILYLYGELKTSRRLAAAIAAARRRQPITTTAMLTAAVERLMPHERQKKDMARLFQALRIEVNHEMDALREMLESATALLGEGGRLSVITYHSLEDRMVKNLIKTGNTEGKLRKDFFGRPESCYKPVGNKPRTACDGEVAANPRSRSAKLRVAEKTSPEKTVKK